MTPEHRQSQRFLALNPANSVAVEACAGSGKTWLLSGRLLRLLLAGVRPGEILAITYTRKAAREIEARLRSLLASLAGAPEAEALAMLTERGLSEAQARASLPRARGLLEAVLRAESPITITTFHGWFARLLGGAPLDSGLVGRSLSEAASSLLDEAWALFAADCARELAAETAQALLFLYGELGASGTRALLGNFIDRRAEWRVWREAQGGLEAALVWLDEAFGAGGDPLAELFSFARLADLDAFARLLGQNTAGDQALAADLAQAVLNIREAAGIAPADLEAVRAALLTAKNEPRARKPSAAQAKRLTPTGEETFLRLHGELSVALQEALGRLQDQRNARLNREALLVGEALLERLDKLKIAQRVMDFADLEGEVDGLLAREGSAAWLQARLDARYKHILLDEFQDTNPLQWRILRGWLDAYAEAGASRPGVFLVGDPKQSIYRFRRAEPRLFTAAAEYFVREFGAQRIGNAHTFRNAPGIVALVNELFSAEPLFAGFTPQTVERADWPGRIEVLPLIPATAAEEAVEETAMREPLTTPRVEAEDARRREEAELLAQRLGEIVAQGGQAWQVRGKDGKDRPARYGDILILTRRKTLLATYEAALREAGIPYTSPGRGGLLGTLEAQDVIATLRFLADPADDLALAQVLRMPVFAAGDELLLRLSAAPRTPWWPRLQAIEQDVEDPALARCVRLLRGWLAASRFLPAHDLIDRMFHEGEWLERCRAVLPDALWPGVHANLGALLELSLNVDAGRYPSITRLVDELRRLSSSDEEAPDEGLIAAQGEDLGRVRIMTIHGAKGLEAPIVWLIDAHGLPRPREGNDVALDWPAEALAPRHFSLLGRVSEAGPLRQPLLEADKEAAQREELNLLYVAITRAEQAFLVSGIESSRKLGATTAYERIAQAVSRLGSEDGVLGELPKGEGVKEPAWKAACSLALQAPLRIGEIRRAAPTNAGQVFGTALHAWLEAHTKGLALPEVAPEVAAAGHSLLERPALRRFFDPACYVRAGSETSFIGPDGKLRRIDRWVDDGETIWVLDYKSGARPDEELLAAYRVQLEEYCAAMKIIFGNRTVQSRLIFTEDEDMEAGAS